MKSEKYRWRQYHHRPQRRSRSDSRRPRPLLPVHACPQFSTLVSPCTEFSGLHEPVCFYLSFNSSFLRQNFKKNFFCHLSEANKDPDRLPPPPFSPHTFTRARACARAHTQAYTHTHIHTTLQLPRVPRLAEARRGLGAQLGTWAPHQAFGQFLGYHFSLVT